MTSGDYEIFGYISNTRIKVIVICGAMYNTLTDDNSPRNNKQLMRSFMLSIYGFYVAAMMNQCEGSMSRAAEKDSRAKLRRQLVNSPLPCVVRRARSKVEGLTLREL